MKHLLVMALAAGVASMMAGGQAQAAKKIHRFHHAQAVYEPRGAPFYSDPSGGNAAAAGNNANSMSGSNSAGENANGRTSGGRS